MTKPYSPEELEHHLNYEIDALSASYEFISTISDLLTKAGANQLQIAHASNIMIENFCLHARLLIEFFTGKEDKTNSAKSFAKNYKIPSKPRKLNQKLNNQISHFMVNRTNNYPEKINEEDIRCLIKWIDCQLEKWKLNLNEKYNSMEIHDVKKPDLSATSIATSGINSTNHIEVQLLVMNNKD